MRVVRLSVIFAKLYESCRILFLVHVAIVHPDERSLKI